MGQAQSGSADPVGVVGRFEGFDGFYAATSHRVVGYLFVVLGSLAEAEDAAHEAYARAWAQWPKVSGYDDPEAWVRRVGFRVGLSAWRKARNRMSAHRRSSPPETVPGLSPDRLAVAEALRRIPAEQRRALALFYVRGLSVAEIAAESGAPEGTVKARLSRGRRALAPHLSEFADDPDRPDSTPTVGVARPGSRPMGNVEGMTTDV